MIKNSIKIKNLKFKIGLLFLLSTFYFLLSTSKAHADTISLGIYPPIIQIDAKPPASITSPITIENTEDQTISLDIILKEFVPSPKENGDIEYLDRTLPPIFGKMQIFDGEHVVTQVKLAPKQKKNLSLHVGIPAGEKASDYYFSVLFVSKAGTVVDSTQSQAIVGIASNVLLSIGPKGPTKGKISHFDAPFFVTRGPVPFQVRLENQSSHYITTQGIITIKNMFGQTIGKIDLLPVNVLAQSTRIIPAPKEGGIDDPKASWNEKFLLGFYTAKATIGLSQEGPIVSKTTTFLAIPLELILGFFVSLIIVVFIVKQVREKQKMLG